MGDKQITIAKEAKLEGIGLHTGQKTSIRFLPAEDNPGYRFTRTDIEGSPVVRAIVENVVATSPGTTIESNGARV